VSFLFKIVLKSLPILMKLSVRILREGIRRVGGDRGACVLGFHRIESPVRGIEKCSYGVGLLRITGYTEAHGELRYFGIFA
jgi:hypothetical protein